MSSTRTDRRPLGRLATPSTPRQTRYVRPTVVPAAATPRVTHRFGDLSCAPFEDLVAATRTAWPEPAHRLYMRKRGLRLLTQYLGKYPGSTWQHRWEESELNTQCISPVDLTDNVNERASLGQALGALYALRVIRPTLPAFLAGHLKKFVDDVLSVEDDPLLDAYVASVRSADVTQAFKAAAIADVCIALIVQGIHFSDLTPEAFLHHAMQVRQTKSRSGLHLNKYIGHLAWQTLCSCGHFPAHISPTLRGALRSPQLTTTEMVDRHGAIDPDVRQMFIDYLDRRSNDVKYSTLNVIATKLVKSFWTQLAMINPRQADLRVSDEHYRQWRATANVREDGTPRSSPWVILSTVQALYYDIQAWAVNEPQQWARWSAPVRSPVPKCVHTRHTNVDRANRHTVRSELVSRFFRCWPSTSMADTSTGVDSSNAPRRPRTRARSSTTVTPSPA